MKKTFSVSLEDELDAREIAEVVQRAGKYESSLHLLVRNAKVNLKSIMGMMALHLTKGDEVTLVAEGADELAAIDGMQACFQRAN